MKGRISFNSKSVQEAFPEVYEEIFSKSSIVVSASGSFFWSGEHAASYGSPAILQLLPVRTYVGVEPATKAGLFFSRVLYFVPSKKSFTYANLFETAEERVRRVLQSEFKNIPDLGLNIYILFENPPGSGINASGSLSAALSLAVNLHLNFLSTEDVKGWERENINTLLRNAKFQGVYRLAWKIDSAIEAHLTSGSSALIPFVSSKYPILYFRDKNFSEEKENSVGERIGKCWAFSFEEFFGVSNSDWPIDFGLIYSGDYHVTQSIISTMRAKRSNLAKRNLAVKKMLKKLLGASHKGTRFLNSSRPDVRTWWSKMADTGTEISIGMWWGLGEIFGVGCSFSELDRFFAFMNAYQRYLFLIEASSFKADKLCLLIRNFVRKESDDLDAGVKLTGAGVKGDVLFAIQKASFFGREEKLLRYLKAEISPDVYLDYASWIDGIGGTGAKVEQDLRNKIYSDYVAQGTVLVKIIDGDGSITTRFLSLKNYRRQSFSPSISIVLDCENSRIFIDGKKMDSGILKSSQTTIEVLRILAQNIGRPVSSNLFPPSSYRDSKSEYMSKIIYPLKDAVKRFAGKDLPIKVEEVSDSYYSTLNPGIGILIREKTF